MKRFQFLIGLAALAGAQVASAVVLPSDTYVSLPGSTVFDQPQLDGIELENTTTDFSFTGPDGLVTGTVQSIVSRSSVDGTLDFFWKITNDLQSQAGIGQFLLGNFLVPTYKADYLSNSVGDVAPVEASNLLAGSGFVNFTFVSPPDFIGTGIDRGLSSFEFYLDTDAKAYGHGGTYTLIGSDTGLSDTYSTFAPVAVPEPSTYALMLGGLAAVGAIARRRRT